MAGVEGFPAIPISMLEPTNLAGCGKTYLLMTSLSAPYHKVGFLPLVLPLLGELFMGLRPTRAL